MCHDKVGTPFQVPLSARGAAFGQTVDNDGFIDIAINCNDGQAIVLRNEGGNGNHWLSIRLVGSASNPRWNWRPGPPGIGERT